MAINKSLALIGMMGTGKSTIGREVAKKIKIKFVDLDKIIEKNEGQSIAELFKKKGEKYFRDIEEKTFFSLDSSKHIILATGGGAFLNKKIREGILKSYISVWLNASIETLVERVSYNINKRPLINEDNVTDSIKTLKKLRDPIYKEANFEINCSQFARDVVIKKVISFYEKNAG